MWCAGLFWPSFLHKSWRSHTLNSQPVCLTEGQIVFPLCFSRLILHLNLLHQPSYLRSASLPISFPTKFFSYKLVISTFLLLLSFKLLVHALLSSKWSVACTNLSVLTLREKKNANLVDLFCYQCLILFSFLPVQMAVRHCNPKHCVQLGFSFDLFWLMVMACFCLGGSWLTVSNRDFIRAGHVSFLRIVLRTETRVSWCGEKNRCGGMWQDTRALFVAYQWSMFELLIPRALTTHIIQWLTLCTHTQAGEVSQKE